MKKFLSVLLALAVAFTFTFGSTMSAFAEDTPVTYNGKTYANEAAAVAAYLADVDAAEQDAKDTLDAQYNIAAATVAANKEQPASGTSISVAAKYWADQLVIEKTDVLNAIAGKTIELKSVSFSSVPSKPVEAAYASVTKNAAALVADVYAGKYAVGALTAAFEANKADIAKAIGDIDTSKLSVTTYATYSDIPNNSYTWTYPTADGNKVILNAKTAADNTKAYIVDAINAIKLADTDDTVEELETKYASVTSAWTAYATYTDSKYALLGNFYTLVQEEADAAKAGATKASQKATLMADIAAYKNTNEYLTATAATTPSKAKIDAFIAAYEEAMTYLIDNGYGYTATVIAYNATTTDNAEKVALAKEDAAAYIAEKNTDGTVKYNEKVVKANLDAIILAAYQATATPTTPYTYVKAELLATATDGTPALISYVTDFDKASYNAHAAAVLEALEEDYYALEYAKVKEAFAAHNAAVNAAVNNGDIAKADSDLEDALDKIATKYEVNTLYSTTLASAVNTATTTASQYLTGLNAGKDPKDVIEYTNEDVVKFLKDNGARTADEITKLMDALKADIAATPTVNDKTNAIKAVKAAIAALPATLNITAADRANILAAKKAYTDLVATSTDFATVTDAEVLTLSNAYNKIRGIDDAEITAAVIAIQAKKDATKVTIADKAAVKAVKELADAYAANYDSATATDSGFVESAIETIRDLEKAAVVAAIDALPTNITAADKDAVEAARAAYDAFVAEYNDPLNNYNAVAMLAEAKANIAKLEAAEATIAELTKYDDIHAKADLLDMSRKLTIWRTSKTSIRVTAVGSVKNIKANGYTVKYSFYKKAPGSSTYKLVKTTTSNKYTYTNLKKGTNKFQVKVKVYDADGKLVATKMTYYRAAKIK